MIRHIPRCAHFVVVRKKRDAGGFNLFSRHFYLLLRRQLLNRTLQQGLILREVLFRVLPRCPLKLLDLVPKPL